MKTQGQDIHAHVNQPMMLQASIASPARIGMHCADLNAIKWTTVLLTHTRHLTDRGMLAPPGRSALEPVSEPPDMALT